MRVLSSAILSLCLLCAGCHSGPQPRWIGTAAPDFTVRDSERTVSLHQFKGKPIILNFWASYCVPCIREMPSLTQLQQEMGPRITVLAVSVDETEAPYRKFLRDHNIRLLTVWDPEKKSSELYGTVMYPETYIIDSSGMVRRKIVGQEDFTSPAFIEYLNKL
ncbi:MAG TPA: TlpA disulfide reductase family protein [Candidatus Angelobacter sp.]